MNKLMVAVAVMTLGALVMVGCGGKSCTTL